MSHKLAEPRNGNRAANTHLIIDLLALLDRCEPETIEKLSSSQSRDSITFEEAVIRAGLATERQVAQAYSRHYFVPFFEPHEDTLPVAPEVAKTLPGKLCRDHQIAPLAVTEEVLRIGAFSPDAFSLVDELQLLTGKRVQVSFATLSVIDRILTVLYEDGSWSTSISTDASRFSEVQEEHDDEGGEAEEADEVIHLDQAPPPGRDGRIIRYVNSIFQQALDTRASDIHIERYEETCRVRLRIDGALVEIPQPPMSMLISVISRIKVLAKMDIAEKRLPQDGAIAMRSGDRRVDLRVNTCPTVFGEKVVLRVLDRNALPHDVRLLGFDARQEQDLLESIQMPHGLMLVTGPTGSGKSTTLYSCLKFLNQPDANICTVEDPVEFKFEGINQVQTRQQVGLTFASALRSFLRQDPDVIMVGEVRDQETGEICIRAALTGHFVLSTLHTNDALSAVTRLAEMGIEPFLLANSLRLVIAQRLVRKLCTCKQPYQLDEITAERYGLDPSATLYRPGGCPTCRDSGYKGRLAVFEVVRITPRLSQLIQQRGTVDQLRVAARESGMSLLAHSAMQKVLQGVTSLEEALGVIVSD